MADLAPAYLKALWFQAVAGWGEVPAHAAWRDLVARHSESHRHYHNLTHLAAMAAFLDEALDAGGSRLALWPEVVVAILFHDAVYDPRASNNEAASAELAERVLADWSGGRVAVVRQLILATRHFQGEAATAVTESEVLSWPTPAGPVNLTDLFLDADLAVLGAAAADYGVYEAAIRREYAWVDAAAYRTGRSAVLRSFLDRPQIYRSAWARERYEAAARTNLAAALAQLTASAETSQPMVSETAAGRRSQRPQRFFYPIILDVTERAILIVGGGRVGFQKVKSLNALGLVPTVVSLTFDPRLADLEATCHQRPFVATDLDAAQVVIVCTDDPALNDEIATQAQARGRLVNNASHPEAGDFIAPASLKRGPYFLAVSSSGTGVKGAVALRDHLAAPFTAWVDHGADT